MTYHDEQQLASQLIDTSRATIDAGLTHGRSGNLSVRVADDFLITPTALLFHTLTPVDIARLTLDGEQTSGGPVSSEWRMHRDLYRANGAAQAIIHVHSPYATGLSCLAQPIPPFHYMVAIAGGCTIPCAPYALFGTQALSDHLIPSIDGHCACLLANHGMICHGANLGEAFELAREIETICHHYWIARCAGQLSLLTNQQMAEVRSRIIDYRSAALSR